MIRKFDTAYFMISVDTPEDNKAFAEKEHADFPMLSDPTKKVATAYGVVNDQRPLAFRWTFYIDPNGKIVFIDKQVKPATSGEDVTAKLKELNVPERR
jgi:peroxiredoxin Q/BCP